MRDDKSYVDFVSARWASLYRTSYLLTGDHAHAEDLLQSALLKAYVAWRRVEAAAAPEAYVRRIVANTFVSGRRRRATSAEEPRAELPEVPIASAEGSYDEQSAMWAMVLRLPPRQRAVVVLRYYEDLTEMQIADALGCSVGTVKSQASDALRSLRRAFAANEAPGRVNGDV